MPRLCDGQLGTRVEPEIDKFRLLEQMRTEYAFFGRTLELLAPDEMLIPNVIGWWSVKDTVAHLACWMEDVVRWFDQAGHGQKPDIPLGGFTDEYVNRLNDQRSARDKDQPLSAVLARFRQAHLDVCELVEDLSERSLFESDWDGLFTSPPWRLIVGNTSDHVYEHLVSIREWLVERRALE